MAKIVTSLLLGVIVFICLLPASAAAAGIYPAGGIGNDVSWPNCKTKPPTDPAFGIVGVNGGLVFKPNQCLFTESHWFKNLSLYLNTGYAGKKRAEQFAGQPRTCSNNDESCLAYDFGYNAGVYALNYAASQYVHANTWWLDVETVNSWSKNTGYNRASLQGMVDAIKHNTLFPTIGFYAYPGQWKTITGGWQNGYPNWAATGDGDRKLAVSYCKGQAFNGGPTWLTQYTTRLDNDYAC